jgi:hypothetical protein
MTTYIAQTSSTTGKHPLFPNGFRSTFKFDVQAQSREEAQKKAEAQYPNTRVTIVAQRP